MKSFLIGRRFFAMALFAGLLAAQTPPGPTDDTLVDQVRVKLSLDIDVNGGALEVTARQGVITLRGPVRSEKAKKKAEKIAAKVKGVKSVVNELTINPVAP
jgi:osmotically-inducible protein OsmY